jgi:hypothetical protein
MLIRTQDKPSRFQSRDSSLFLTVMQLVASAAIMTLIGCSSSLELTSEWTSHEISVDGSSNDWADLPTRIVGPDVRVGVKNDKDYLYVCMTTPNRSTQLQMLALGTTVWFDAEGKKGKTLGIQFPVRGLLQGRRPSMPGNAEEANRAMEGLVNTAQRQFEIIGPGAGERKMITDRHEVKGIDVHLGYGDGTLIYELKMPLQRTAETPYGMNIDAAQPPSIGFETGAAEEGTRPQMGGSNRLAGGSAGARGGRGGGATTGGGPAIPGTDSPEPLKHWITVHVAGSTSGTTK